MNELESAWRKHIGNENAKLHYDEKNKLPYSECDGILETQLGIPFGDSYQYVAIMDYQRKVIIFFNKYIL